MHHHLLVYFKKTTSMLLPDSEIANSESNFHFEIKSKPVKIQKFYYKKFYIAWLFSTCGHTVALKLCAHVIKGIPSTHATFRGNWLKITWWWKKYRCSDTDSCVQRWVMKCYSVLNTTKCFSLSWISVPIS